MEKLAHNKSVKHLIIDKANTTMLIAVSISVFIVVFSIFAVKALVSQSLYHQRVTTKQEEALKVLKQNSVAASDLRQAYIAFAGQAINVLGGNPTGTGARDGDNAQIVLDALPAEYDFPALSSSIEKILVEGGYQITTIGGAEDPSLVGSSSTNNATQATGTPTGSTPQTDTTLAAGSAAGVATTTGAVEIPFPFTVDGTQESISNLLSTLESSIRPFYVTSLIIDGQGQAGSLQTSIGLKTFYQPGTTLKIGTTEVK